jgi:hypothetical protein
MLTMFPRGPSTQSLVGPGHAVRLCGRLPCLRCQPMMDTWRRGSIHLQYTFKLGFASLFLLLRED